MKTLLAFTKKEITWQIRSFRLLILGILFVVLGVMNPVVAKLTPWILEMMSETLAETGMNITVTTVTAMDSWTQFFKNLPMGLIAFLLLESNIFTREYSKGTLVLSLTKGLPRYQVVLSKTFTLFVLWTAGYWTCFGITYGCNAYFWDNAVAQNLAFSAVCWWLFGVFAVSLTVLFSALSSANIGVLGGVGGVMLACYLLGFLPHAGKYFPAFLADGASLVYGLTCVREYVGAVAVTAAASLLSFFAGLIAFERKQL